MGMAARVTTCTARKQRLGSAGRIPVPRQMARRHLPDGKAKASAYRVFIAAVVPLARQAQVRMPCLIHSHWNGCLQGFPALSHLPPRRPRPPQYLVRAPAHARHTAPHHRGRAGARRHCRRTDGSPYAVPNGRSRTLLPPGSCHVCYEKALRLRAGQPGLLPDLVLRRLLLGFGGGRDSVMYAEKGVICNRVMPDFIAVRLRSNKKVQNLSKMCYKFFWQPLVAQGDFGHEFS